MKTLDLSQINILAPYPVWYEEGEIMFKTDYNILYSIAFELDDMLNLKAYWFRITNRSRKKSPNDKKIQQTVILVIEEFFRKILISFYIFVTQPMNNRLNETDCFYAGLMAMNRKRNMQLEQQQL